LFHFCDSSRFAFHTAEVLECALTFLWSLVLKHYIYSRDVVFMCRVKMQRSGLTFRSTVEIESE
jgi:hypothetical protein